MTKEDKDLLLKDLYARLPYEVKCKYYSVYENCYEEGTISGVERKEYIEIGGRCANVEEVKPYLFPLSVMTEEQNDSWRDTWFPDLMISTDVNYPESEKYLVSSHVKSLQWLYENHFDINGLIDKGLALDATDKNIY